LSKIEKKINNGESVGGELKTDELFTATTALRQIKACSPKNIALSAIVYRS
jgi:hypothetical protein